MEKMSDDEYQMKQFFENQKPVCIEADLRGNCLMSAKWVLFDFSEINKLELPTYQPKLFREELKTNNDDTRNI